MRIIYDVLIFLYILIVGKWFEPGGNIWRLGEGSPETEGKTDQLVFTNKSFNHRESTLD